MSDNDDDFMCDDEDYDLVSILLNHHLIVLGVCVLSSNSPFSTHT